MKIYIFEEHNKWEVFSEFVFCYLPAAMQNLFETLSIANSRVVMKGMRLPLFLLCTFLLSVSSLMAQNNFSSASGRLWSTDANWSLGHAPWAGENVTIPAGDSCVVDINTSIVNNVTVNGVLYVNANNFSSLKLAGNMTVAGTLRNDGTVEMTVSGKTFSLAAGATYVHNPFNNVLLDESLFYMSNESFNATSNLLILRWFDISVPVGDATRVQASDFGNLTLAVNTAGLQWNQKGKFSPNRIKGSLTISNGFIVMDDGQGFTTALTLQNVTVTGNGNIVVRTGTVAGNYTLTTQNFTDNSAAANYSVILDTSFTQLNWTVTGNLNISHNFSALRGSLNETGGDIRITVTGDVNISGGDVVFVRQADAPFRLTVSGTTTISGSPGRVRFIDGNSGALTFTTNNFVISGGTNNQLLGLSANAAVPKPLGAATITITNDFLINGLSTSHLVNCDTNINKLRITVGRDFVMSAAGSQLFCAKHKGAFTMTTGRHFTLLDADFAGIDDSLNSAIDSLIVGADFLFNAPTATRYFRGNKGSGANTFNTGGNFTITASGTGAGQGVVAVFNNIGTLNFRVTGDFIQNGGQFYGIYQSRAGYGNGSLTFTVNGALDQNAGKFYGIHNMMASNNSLITFSVNSVDFDGGFFSAYHAAHNSPTGVANFTITNNCKVNFLANADTFAFVGLPLVTPDFNQFSTVITVGGSLIISGANGTFLSSFGNKSETVSITGNVSISSGNNYFNPQPPVGSTTHKVFKTVGGNYTVTGGNTFFSTLSDSLVSTINGDYAQTNGTVSVKGRNGYSLVNILGGYTQTNGTFFLHNSTTSTNDQITVVVNSNNDAVGNFMHSGGTINFDNNASGNLATPPTLNVKSPSYSISGAGSMIRAGTTNLFGNLRFSYTGTTGFTRSGSHNIQQVKQFIDNGTSLDVTSGNLQVASYNVAFTLDLLTVMNTGTVSLRTNSIFSNQTLANSGITVFGRLRTQHVNGFYNNTNSAALDASGGMNFFLQTGSTVEYYGVDNQEVTGFGIGLATIGALHKYYNLDINFAGTPDIEYAYASNNPSLNSVYIRKRLNLLAGEFNLNHNGIGRNIILEDTLTTSMTRASGYIKSEMSDGTALVKWRKKTQPGAFKFLFGYSSNPADTIPFTFENSTGNADTVMVSTYHTNFANLPFPPTVTHVRDLFGADNSANTVDRFWNLIVTGPVATANLTFIATSAETGAILNPRAQRWVPAPLAWEYPYQGVQSNVTGGTKLTGAINFPNWWTLSGLANPLPIELASLNAECVNDKVAIKWTTASETNNQFFTITRSFDGLYFENIGTIDAAGNSTANVNYSFIDESPLNSTSYYKLVQTDYDGRQEEFGPVVLRNCKEQYKLNVLVASTSADLVIIIESPYKSNFSLQLFDSKGKVTYSTHVLIQEGYSRISLPTSMLAAGIYQLSLASDRESISRKVVKN